MLDTTHTKNTATWARKTWATCTRKVSACGCVRGKCNVYRRCLGTICMMCSSLMTFDAQDTVQLKKAAPDITYCENAKLNPQALSGARRSSLKQKARAKEPKLLASFFAQDLPRRLPMRLAGSSKWIAQMSNLNWALVLISFSLLAS